MKKYQCRWLNGEIKEWQTIETEEPEDAAATLAEEYGLKDGEIVEVKGYGQYEVEQIIEVVYEAIKKL